ncbi:MAG: four helix bundle protein [Bacteroidota bacterium]
MKHNFKHLNVWKRSRSLVKEVYELSRDFPAEERYGLTSQIRRSAISIPSNIAEGCGRDSDNQLHHFLGIAIGSNCEVETQLYLAFDLNLITEEELETITSEVMEIRMMLIGFQNRIRPSS